MKDNPREYSDTSHIRFSSGFAMMWRMLKEPPKHSANRNDKKCKRMLNDRHSRLLATRKRVFFAKEPFRGKRKRTNRSIEEMTGYKRSGDFRKV